MRVTGGVLSGLALAASALAANPQLVVAPAPAHPSDSPPLTPPETNALVAHLLGVARHTVAPAHRGAPDSSQLAFLDRGDDDHDGRKVVVVLECGKGACNGACHSNERRTQLGRAR